MSSKPPVYIDFCDFGRQMPKTDNFFTRILEKKYEVKIADKPDLLFHSHDGNVHRLYTCRKVFHTVETYKPDFSISDYAFTFHEMDDPHNLRLPNYAARVDAANLIKGEGEPETVAAEKKRFCCFFTSYANAKTRVRINFFQQLSRYKKVDSAGKWNNNIGCSVPNDPTSKTAFLRQYKFYLAFENESLPGYTSEKIAEAMAARCLPIYWGNPKVDLDFNPKSFLNYHHFPSEEALIDRIIEIDRDDNLYLQYLREPYFYGNKPNLYYDRNRILDFLVQAIEDPSPPVAARRKFFRLGRWMLVKRNKPHEMSATSYLSLRDHISAAPRLREKA
jgi:alpha(1,3/1,4) fucosyltransferase